MATGRLWTLSREKRTTHERTARKDIFGDTMFNGQEADLDMMKASRRLDSGRFNKASWEVPSCELRSRVKVKD